MGRAPDDPSIEASSHDAPRRLAGVSRALVVEDNAGIRRAIVRMLETFGVEVQHAASVKHAAGLMLPPLDLVVADVRLPDGSGQAVIAAALRLSPVPVLVAISGVATATEAFDLARSGVVAFLVKPFGLHELERCLKDACDRRAAARASDAHPLSRSAERAWEELVRRYRLTPRQAEVVRRTAEGTRRGDLPRVLGISEASCKTLVRRVLQRCGSARLSDLAFVVLAARDDSELPAPLATPRAPAVARLHAAVASRPRPRATRDEPT
jgi:DNA-binding NarL/FixJ family response regulator